MATNIKGPAIFLAQFAGDAAPFNSWDAICQLGRLAGLQGRADPELGRAALRPQEGGGVQDLLRRDEGRPPRARASTITELSTHLQGQLVAVHPAYDEAFDVFAPAERARQAEGAAEMGGRADDARRQGLAQSRPDAHGHLLRRAGLALSLSMAAAPGRADRHGLRGAGQALDADPRCL